MIAHTDIQLALRAKLLTLVVCASGPTTLSTTATGYARTAGSFLVDGFCPGMEITPAGFAANVVDTIRSISDDGLTITTKNARTAERAAAGRSLTVGLPVTRLWENAVPVTAIQQGTPYVEEQYLPGPESLDSGGKGGLITMTPMYSPRVYVPENTGISADGRYADAIKALFTPKTQLTIPGGGVLRVRQKPAPFRGQRGKSAVEGWSCIPITIPCWTQTTNTL